MNVVICTAIAIPFHSIFSISSSTNPGISPSKSICLYPRPRLVLNPLLNNRRRRPPLAPELHWLWVDLTSRKILFAGTSTTCRLAALENNTGFIYGLERSMVSSLCGHLRTGILYQFSVVSPHVHNVCDIEFAVSCGAGAFAEGTPRWRT